MLSVLSMFALYSFYVYPHKICNIYFRSQEKANRIFNWVKKLVYYRIYKVYLTQFWPQLL